MANIFKALIRRTQINFFTVSFLYLRTPSRSHCSIFGRTICGTNEMTMTATSFFLPDPTWGRA
jgi:hypothetical protein